MNGIESACRSNTVERNLDLWNQMKQVFFFNKFNAAI
jgi:hypothetical protein